MSDVVGTSVSIESSNARETSTTLSNAQEQEVNDVYEFLNLEKNKYVQYKIISDTLEECVNESSDLDRSLKDKVRDILLGGSATQTLFLDEYTSKESTTLFGICGINEQELNYIERHQLQKILELKLDCKYKDICGEFHKITNKDVNTAFETPSSLQMASDDKVLIEYKNKLVSEQEQYVKNLLNLLELLEEISNLRLKKLPQVTEQKIKECQVEQKMNNLKSLLAQEKIRIDIFTETSSSLKAYKELIKDIKEQQKDCEMEIWELKNLKEKYNQVSCKQYNDILKSYLQYKSSIEKKKLLYSHLKN
ncbi:uncharacterized protein LOC108910813 [Anoplophora glabripennis]|uniref:uncharacterized protein LOC108910813 n=1 Tax=Anoplophora glabripennis TaxID=217634 RepID=UPI0008753108|nr:uncharacterized protein LOC108910813 [Anoplophora glabripennis]